MNYSMMLIFAAMTSMVLGQMTLNKIHTKSSNIFKNGGGSMKLDDYDNFQYYGIFTLGTPAQQITIITDTGSNQLWIPTNKATCYRASASSTANITKTKGHIQYGQGYVAGYMGTEMLGAPGLNLSNLSMITLFVDEEKQMGEQQACGLMGLSNSPNWKNFLDVAVSAGQLQDAQFAFQLQGKGNYTYFYAGSESFPNQVTWFPVVKQNFWAISLTSTIVDEHTYEQPTGMKEAVLDTGTSLVIMAQNAYNGIIANAQISKQCQNEGYIICPCKGTDFPDVYFASNGHKMKVKPDDYLTELTGEFCLLGFDVGNPEEIPFVILGDVFFRNYFYALDKAQNRLGLFGSGLDANNQIQE